MTQSTEQLFEAFVHDLMQHGYGHIYTRDLHQAVPADCGFIRVRFPGSALVLSLGIVQFATREEGVLACKAFVESCNEPIEWHMNFPRESSQLFLSPTFASAEALARSRWYRFKRACRLRGRAPVA